MAADGSITIDTRIDNTNVNKSLKTITKNIEDGFKGAEKVANAALAGIAAGIAAVGAASLKFAKATDRIDKMSNQLGMSRQAFQEWDYVLSQNGASVDGLGVSIRTMSEDMELGGVALSKLGVSLTDSTGEAKSQQEIFKDSIIAFQNMEAGAEKTALAQDIFGRSSLELMPLLNGSTESMEGLITKANDLGLVLGDDTVNAGVVLTDQIDTLKRTVEALVNDALLPVIEQANEIITGFTEWATEGGKLKKIITGVIDTAKTLIDLGIPQAILAVAVSIKIASVAMAALNAVMDANPISLIILAVAALVAGIVVLYKNWDKVTAFMSEQMAIVKANVLLAAAKMGTAFDVLKAGMAIVAIDMKLGFVTAFNSIKIGAISLSNIIVNKLLGAVGSFLEIVGKLPFVGDLFQGLGDKVKGIQGDFDNLTKEAVQSSEDMITAAENEKIAVIESKTASVNASIAEKDALIAAKKEEIAAIYEQREKRRLVLEEVETDSVNAIESSDAPAVAQTLGEEISESLGSGIENSTAAVETSLANTTSYISELIGNISSGTIASNIDSVIGMFSDLAAGVSQVYSGDIAGGAMSIAGGLGTALNLMDGLLSSFFDAVDYLADFTVAGVLETLDETLTGLENFFKDGGELYLISDMINQAALWIGEFVTGLTENKDEIFDEVKNIFNTLASTISENTDVFTEIGDFIGEMLVVIIKNLPTLLKAGLKMITAIVDGIMDNIDEIIDATISLITTMSEYISDHISDIVEIGIKIISAIANALLDNSTEIIMAMTQILPQIILAISENMPEIVEALAKVIPKLIVALALLYPTLLLSWALAIATLVVAFATLLISIPEIVVALFTGLGEGFYEGFWNIIDAATDFGTAFVKIFSMLGENIVNGLETSGDIGTAIWDNMSPGLEIMGDSLEDFFSPLASVASDLGTKIWKNMSSGFEDMINNLSSVFMSAAKIIKSIADMSVGNVSSLIGTVSSAVSSVASIFSYDTGSAYIEEDQVANIHQGERIIPKTFNDSIMSGETMMLSSDAFSSIMGGLSGGMSTPSVGAATTQAIQLTANITGIVEADGREIARTSFQYIDEFVGGAYGS